MSSFHVMVVELSKGWRWWVSRPCADACALCCRWSGAVVDCLVAGGKAGLVSDPELKIGWGCRCPGLQVVGSCRSFEVVRGRAAGSGQGSRCEDELAGEV